MPKQNYSFLIQALGNLLFLNCLTSNDDDVQFLIFFNNRLASCLFFDKLQFYTQPNLE